MWEEEGRPEGKHLEHLEPRAAQEVSAPDEPDAETDGSAIPEAPKAAAQAEARSPQRRLPSARALPATRRPKRFQQRLKTR